MNLLHCLGIGTVASTKQTNTNTILVNLATLSPQGDGRTVATSTPFEDKSRNAEGEEVVVKGMTSNVFPAEWTSLGDANRITSPDVREGSQVAIYTTTGSNVYYWTTWGVNAETFRLEHIVWGYSANPELKEDTPFNIDNFYTVTMSPMEGFASYRTSQVNGEQTTFEVKIDSKNGKLTIAGGQRNYAVFDDIAHSFTYTNVDGSVADVNKKNITFYAPDSVSFKADEKFNILTKNFNLQCTQIAVQADTAEIRIKKTKWIGDIDQVGNIAQTGNTTSTGTIHADIDVTSLTSLNYHIHPGVFPGPSVTGQPVPMVAG